MHASPRLLTIAACAVVPGCDDVAAVYSVLYVHARRVNHDATSSSPSLQHCHSNGLFVQSFKEQINIGMVSVPYACCLLVCGRVCCVCASVLVRDSHTLPSTHGVHVEVALNASALTPRLHWPQACISKFFLDAMFLHIAKLLSVVQLFFWVAAASAAGR